MSETREKLARELMAAAWADVAPHVASLFVVAPEAGLIDIGEAVVHDDAARVGAWVEDGTLRRPTSEELEAWGRESPSFAVLIVQPFVLCQPALER